MKTVIVPTDFSPVADNAMQFAVDMATNIGASVLLLHVYQLPVSISEVPVVVTSAEDLKKDSEAKLIKLKDKIESATDYKVKIYTETRLGNVIDELEELTHVVQPFAVVMGSLGASKMERLLFGSTTLQAIRHLEIPVLVIPPGVSFKPVQRIGLACDFKDVVPSTPEKEIRTVVKEFNAELHVLNVDHDNKHFSAQTPEESFLLHNMIADLKPQYHFIDKDDIEEGLNEFTEKNNIDFLMVIPKKHKILKGLFHKSHSQELAFHSHVPVMAIHE
jgi:nucleotide-binding universal stress UspA family protein